MLCCALARASKTVQAEIASDAFRPRYWVLGSAFTVRAKKAPIVGTLIAARRFRYKKRHGPPQRADYFS